MKKLTYTFRTSPFKNLVPDIFIFGKLKKDFSVFSNKILKEKPQLIIGIAKSSRSQIEKIAINQYNKTKKISKKGREIFSLHIPHNNPFPVAHNQTDSFCNWTAYKISEFIKENNLDTKLAFIHLNEKDSDKLENI